MASAPPSPPNAPPPWHHIDSHFYGAIVVGAALVGLLVFQCIWQGGGWLLSRGRWYRLGGALETPSRERGARLSDEEKRRALQAGAFPSTDEVGAFISPRALATELGSIAVAPDHEAAAAAIAEDPESPDEAERHAADAPSPLRAATAQAVLGHRRSDSAPCPL